MTATAVIEATLADSGLDWDRTGDGTYAVTLPGSHKLKTTCNLIVGRHALRVEAFVMRQPDENREQLWAWLLRRNARLYGVSFAIDQVGDVYLMGRIPVAAVTAEEVDRLLGAVLTYADESFDTMLSIGFGSAIRREWEWRVKRGESLANLRAFAHFADPSRDTAAVSAPDPSRDTAGGDQPRAAGADDAPRSAADSSAGSGDPSRPGAGEPG